MTILAPLQLSGVQPCLKRRIVDFHAQVQMACRVERLLFVARGPGKHFGLFLRGDDQIIGANVEPFDLQMNHGLQPVEFDLCAGQQVTLRIWWTPAARIVMSLTEWKLREAIGKWNYFQDGTNFQIQHEHKVERPCFGAEFRRIEKRPMLYNFETFVSAMLMVRFRKMASVEAETS